MQSDTRGQVVQIAALLLFAFVVIAFAGYQTTVVPQQTAAAEQEHSQGVTVDLTKLQLAVERTAATGEGRSVSVRMAPRYETRLLALNPPRASGSLRTAETGVIAIDNAEALDDETADYWNGTERIFETNRLEYSPNYNEFDDPPLRVYEASVLYDRAPEGTVVRSGQRIVDGNTIRLTAMRGDLEVASTGTVTIEPRPLSAPERTVPIEGDELTIRIPTRLPEERWRQLLSEEDSISDIDCDGSDPEESCETLLLEFEDGEYDLRLSAIGVGSVGSTGEDATYLTDVRGDGTTIPEGGKQQVVARALDGFNTPVAGENVQAEVFEADNTGNLQLTDGTVEPESVTTETNGNAVFVFNASDDVQGNEETHYVVADISEADVSTVEGEQLTEIEDDPERAVFEITVFRISGNGNGNGGNGGPPNDGGSNNNPNT